MNSKKTRFISGSMALIMLATGCSNNAGYSGTSDMSGDSAVVQQSATSVENQAVTVNGLEYSYTGGWKDSFPDGYGELYLDDYNYIKGNWADGLLSGHVEYRATNEEGDYLVYIGEFSDNQPSGAGELYMLPGSSEDCIYISGDFSDTDTLTYYNLDKDNRLCDIGCIMDGDFVSYIDNPQIEGMSFVPSKYDYGINNGLMHGASIVGQKGEYFGQVDGNGSPSGLGYCRMTYDLESSDTTEDYTIGILGQWDGENYSGPVLWLEESNGSTVTTTKNWLGMSKETVSQYDVTTKVVGFYNGEDYYGDYEAHTTYKHDPPQDDDGLFITKKIADTYDDNTKFTLCDDGLYRGCYLTQEYYLIDGTFGYSKRRKVCKKSEDGVIYGDFAMSKAAEEGDYCNYDADGNVIDFGILFQGGGESYMPEREKKTNILNAALTVGAAMLTAYAGYKLVKWSDEQSKVWCDNYLEEVRTNIEADQQKFDDDLAQYKENKALAEEYRRKAQYGSEESMRYNLEQAQICEDEAMKHYRFSLAFD